MKIWLTIVISFLLTACVSTPDSSVSATGPDQPVSYVGNADLALELAEALQSAVARDDARLNDAGEEMAALLAIFDEPDTLPGPSEQARPPVLPERPSISQDNDPALPPPPDLTGSRSILHAAHIASYRERELAQQGWLVFSQSEAFEGLRARVEPVELDSGSWLRLKAGPFDDAEQVRQFCEPIRSRGDWCAITDFSGDPVDNSTD